MKNIFFTLPIIIVSLIHAQGQPTVHNIKLVANTKVMDTVNLNQGIFLHDLSWAWNKQNACFPKTQQSKFTGKHVFYSGIIPKQSEITITVIPKDPTVNLSIYAYEIGINSNYLVPNLPSCIRCEADYKLSFSKKGKKQGHIRTIKNLVAINNPYRIIIGITGADKLEEAEFILIISTKPRK
ncbi:MAG TPA: hypothetical protein ENK46_04465 [Flavobacteriia bacterium]|jgi:hypothetical protein|nr:hypothetical protein [Flavobacteriia bacterium]